MKKLINLNVLLFIISLSSFSQIDEFGVFNLENAALASQMNLDVVRVFANVGAYTYPNIIPNKISRIKALHDEGVKVVLTARWDLNSENFTILMGNPTIEDRLVKFKTFITNAGAYIDYITLDNEPVTHWSAILKTEANGSIPLIAWFDKVVDELNTLITNNPNLNHIKLCSPGFNNIEGYRLGTMNGAIKAFFDILFNWSKNKPELWAIDLHLHDRSSVAIKDNLALLRGQTIKSFIATEWSQAKVTFDWLLENLDTNFASTYTRTGTNEDYVNYCYGSPVISLA